MANVVPSLVETNFAKSSTLSMADLTWSISSDSLFHAPVDNGRNADQKIDDSKHGLLNAEARIFVDDAGNELTDNPWRLEGNPRLSFQ